MAHPAKRRPTTPPVLTIEEVAECCDRTVSTIRRWIHDPENPLPHRTLGRLRIVVMPDDLRAWADAQGLLLLLDPHEIARPWPRSDAA